MSLYTYLRISIIPRQLRPEPPGAPHLLVGAGPRPLLLRQHHRDLAAPVPEARVRQDSQDIANVSLLQLRD